MIEQIARAMREANAEPEDRPLVPFETAPSRGKWMICARAAIEAMREADRPMSEHRSRGIVKQLGEIVAQRMDATGQSASEVVRSGWFNQYLLDQALEENSQAYRAMITAALGGE